MFQSHSNCRCPDANHNFGRPYEGVTVTESVAGAISVEYRNPHCTSGCPTQDHESYGQCLRSKTIKVAYCNSVNGQDATRQKRFDKTNEAYRNARKAGLQPKGVEMRHVRAAEQAAAGEGITVSFENAE